MRHKRQPSSITKAIWSASGPRKSSASINLATAKAAASPVTSTSSIVETGAGGWQREAAPNRRLPSGGEEFGAAVAAVDVLREGERKGKSKRPKPQKGDDAEPRWGKEVDAPGFKTSPPRQPGQAALGGVGVGPCSPSGPQPTCARPAWPRRCDASGTTTCACRSMWLRDRRPRVGMSAGLLRQKGQKSGSRPTLRRWGRGGAACGGGGKEPN